MRIFGKGFNYSQDGPGNRLVYHLSGCNMHCIWCSNPDGMDLGAGKEVPVGEILRECVSCRPMFFSGGGVTFTGGEATLQHDQLLETLQALHAEGIHTCLETNGTCRRLPALAAELDYLIMDFKHHDSALLKQYTGLGNETVKENFAYFCKTGRQLHVRIPLINGINADTPEEFARYFSQHNTQNVVFEFLAYHEYGKEKWKSEYRVHNGFIPADTIPHFTEVFHHYGLRTTST